MLPSEPCNIYAPRPDSIERGETTFRAHQACAGDVKWRNNKCLRYFRHSGVPVEVCLKGLLSGLKDQMAVLAVPNVPLNYVRDAWRKPALQVFANQSDRFSACHRAPWKTLPRESTVHAVLQLSRRRAGGCQPLKISNLRMSQGQLRIGKPLLNWELFSGFVHSGTAIPHVGAGNRQPFW